MDKQWTARMNEATSFEAGKLYQSKAYHRAARARTMLGRALWAAIPPKAEPLLDDYLDALDDLTEFEVMHYFQEGYHLGLRAAAKKALFLVPGAPGDRKERGHCLAWTKTTSPVASRQPPREGRPKKEGAGAPNLIKASPHGEAGSP